MNTHQSYTLASRPQTNPMLRGWAVLSRGTFSGAIFLTDVALIVATSCLTGIAYHLVAYGNRGNISSFVQVGLLAASIFAVSNMFRREYRLPNFFSFKPHARRTIQLWNVTLICLLMLGFLAQISVDYSRGWILLFYVTTLAASIVQRYVIVRATALARAAGLLSAQRIFLIGTGTHVGSFINRYEPWTLGINIVGCRFLTPVVATAPVETRRAILDRDLAEAVASVRSLEPDAIFVLLPWSATETIDRCAETFLALPVEIHLGPEQVLHKFEEAKLSTLGPLASLQLTRRPLTRREIIQKRLFDLVFAAAALLLSTPLLIIVALLIKLDSPGPIFFVQRRFGFNQQPFRIIKFRSMRTLDDGPVIQQARPDDPRLTGIGRWLRRWNVDEIPQLFNVLTGDMSLVGPRPHALSHDREYERRISLYARRHNMKPGITGWAQIHGLRGETDTDEKMRKRVEYDLFYIDNWSLWLDLKIIARTVLSRASYQNAY
jgi:Undecaprenyl-phosphate glucose phosphotransferase